MDTGAPLIIRRSAAASRLRISLKSLDRLLASGDLTRQLIGRYHYVTVASIEALEDHWAGRVAESAS